MRWSTFLGLVLLGCLVWLASRLDRPPRATLPTPAPNLEEPYARKSYGGWVDADHDCQDTRQEVLIAESLVPVTFADARHCNVARGRWRCPYSGRVFTDPKLLDIDHLVPLRYAHEHGGSGWSRRERRAYANDLSHADHLVAVSARANRQKGAKGPDAWRPSDAASWCWYGRAFRDVSRRWDLALPAKERSAIDHLLRTCPHS